MESKVSGTCLDSTALTDEMSLDGRQILNDLTGSIAGGRLLAILGPTGAGKSTFVDLLAGKRKRGRRTGAVEIALPQGAKARKCLVGYVDQHDVLPATSTVREALMFAAELKLGEDMSRAEKSSVAVSFSLAYCTDDHDAAIECSRS